MLLQHAWLAPLIKPDTITEEDEEAAEAEAEADAQAEVANDGAEPTEPKGPPEPVEVVVDQEVADWVKETMEKRKNGTLGKGAQKPALHAAPLDALSSPSHNGTDALAEAVPA